MNASEKLRSLLADKTTRVAVLTGAGISKESGVPTFRDPDGIWARFRPEELANMEAFLENTELVWQWYQHRRKLINSVKPNAGHYTLAKMETFFDDFTLITQNVDNLHQVAGNKNVIELHGNIQRNYCVSCGADDLEIRDESAPPSCKLCGSKIRPGVVWFGERIPVEALERASQAAVQADLFFCIGTSGVVYPAAGLPALAETAHRVEVNPTPTALSHQFAECFLEPSGEALPHLFP